MNKHPGANATLFTDLTRKHAASLNQQPEQWKSTDGPITVASKEIRCYMFLEKYYAVDEENGCECIWIPVQKGEFDLMLKVVKLERGLRERRCYDFSDGKKIVLKGVA